LLQRQSFFSIQFAKREALLLLDKNRYAVAPNGVAEEWTTSGSSQSNF
jgi:hypothetical protein